MKVKRRLILDVEPEEGPPSKEAKVESPDESEAAELAKTGATTLQDLEFKLGGSGS